MTTPYRNDVDALRERLSHLSRELEALRAQTSTLEGLKNQEKAIADEIAQVQQRLGAGGPKRTLPLLDSVKVASPCNASWDDMLGDDRVRHCLKCEKDVYNLSNMPREEAEALLASRIGGDADAGSTCVRFYQRADGTVMTSDCPVGAKRKRRRKVALAVAGAGAMAVAATSFFSRSVCQGGVAGTMQGEVAMGKMSVVEHVPAVMGTVAPPQVEKTPAPAPKR